MIESSYCLFHFWIESEVDRMGTYGGGWHMVMILFNQMECLIQFILCVFQAE